MTERRCFIIVRPRTLDERRFGAYTDGHERPLDPLGEALHFLRMSGTFYCRCEFTAPWGLALPLLKTP